MTSQLDRFSDTSLAAIAGLVRSAVPDDLGVNSTDIFTKVYEDPRYLTTLTGDQMPALAIYRDRESRYRQYGNVSVRKVRVLFDYLLPATNLDARQNRWPALQSVWNSIADMVIRGYLIDNTTTPAGKIQVLDAACIDVDIESPKVDYDFAHGKAVYPIFRGSIEVDITPADVDVATLDNFLTLFVTYDEPGDDHSIESRLAEDLITFPAYGS